MGARYCETCGEAHQQIWRERLSTEEEKERFRFWHGHPPDDFFHSMYKEEAVSEICWVKVPKDLMLENRRSYSQGPADSEKEWNKAMAEGEFIGRVDRESRV